MNAWEKRRRLSGWKYSGLAEWTKGNTAHLSVVFSWNLVEAYQKAAWYKSQGYNVKAGGPAVRLNRDYLSDVANVSDDSFPDAIAKHNPNATFTSRGCVRQCRFCLVPKTEGDITELNKWPIRPIVCDNNLLACSKSHFDSVIDKLKLLNGIDFNQGLDARLLTKYHAERIAELNIKMVRLAWDHIGLENQFRSSWEILRNAGIPKSKIAVYILIGYVDKPDDALHRLRSVWELGALPFPMRYQPLDALKRNSYIGKYWTEDELKRYMRYWSNLRHLSGVPFKEYDNRIRKLDGISPDQMEFVFQGD